MPILRQSGATYDVLIRARRSLDWNGPFGVARLIVMRPAYSRAEFIWYEASLADLERIDTDGLRVSQVRADGAYETLRPLWTLSPREAAAKVSRGGQLWTAARGEDPIFSAWTFRDTTELRLGRRLLVPLPPRTVVLEQVYTAPSSRAKGVASKAIRAIAAGLADSADRLVAVVDVSNSASRRAMLNAGLREAAITSAWRVGPWGRSTVRGRSSLADHLRHFLDASS